MRHLSPRTLALIFLGGLLGTILRDQISQLDGSVTSIPYGILIANIAGSFVLGGVISYLSEFEPVNALNIRAAWGTGFCGGLTTFSTLCAGIFDLSRHGPISLAITYAVISLLLGIVAFGVALFSVRLVRSLRVES